MWEIYLIWKTQTELTITLTKWFIQCTTNLKRSTNNVLGRPMELNDEGKRLIRPGKDAIKLARMYEVAHIVQMMLPHLNENQFSAVVSFAYDVSLSRFKRSKLRRLLEHGEYFLAAREIEDWQYRTDKPTKQRRRRAEKRLFLKPVLIKNSGELTPKR